MFDHVTIRAADRSASEHFYRTALSELGVKPSHIDSQLIEWDDFSIVSAGADDPPTRHLHVGFAAASRAEIDAFWQAGVDAGYRDDGAPGEGPQYGRDLEATERFYSALTDYTGFAPDHRWEAGGQFRGRNTTFSLMADGRPPTENLHLAFAAPARGTVDDFHRAALAAGYRSNGEPGERPHYHPGYYAAYVLDPDGSNVELVFHGRA